MLFCLGDGKWESKGEGYQKNNRIFNKDVSKEVYDKAISSKPKFELPIAKWVEPKDLPKDGQTETAKQIGGLLKTISYKDAWKEAWATASDKYKNWVKNLPNFDSEIFEKITGIKFSDSLIGQEATVEICGKKYKAKITSEE